MGTAVSKPARTAPARYVAKQLERDSGEVAEEFKRAKNSIQGINKSKEHIPSHPQPYMESTSGNDRTDKLDMSAPKWYVNAYLDMMDQARECHTVISGNIPFAWERDKYEPYALIRNRVDDEDIDWLLKEDVKKQPLEVLLEHTKLEREALEDILAYVERPRTQYRNYQGKLHKAVENQNSFIEDRRKRMEEAREDELLKEIGYSDEDLTEDRQYRTLRTRGMRTLDQLGVSIRERKRLDRAKQHSDMQAMLEQRRMDAIEAGEYQPSEEELLMEPDQLAFKGRGSTYHIKKNHEKRMYAFDIGANQHAWSKISWWHTRRSRIPQNKDPVYGQNVFSDRLQKSDDQMNKDIMEAAEYHRAMSAANGNRSWMNPITEYNHLMQVMKENKERDEKAAMEMEEIQRSIYGTKKKKSGEGTPLKVVPMKEGRDMAKGEAKGEAPTTSPPQATASPTPSAQAPPAAAPTATAPQPPKDPRDKP